MIQRGKMVVFWTLILIVHLEGFFCQPLLFKRTSASTSLLSNAVHFVASSRIECSLDCLYKTGHYSCMAFAYNETEGVCTCGKRRLAPPAGTSPGGAAIHTNVDCSIAKRDFDLILINGGTKLISGNHYAQKASTLITLDQAITTCSPPSDMKESREGHAIGMSGGNLTVCGGSRLKTCSFYDKCKAEWIPVSEELYNIRDKFPWVQLDKNRIWIGPGRNNVYKIEVYDQGSITDLGPHPTGAAYTNVYGASACKLSEDKVILIGGQSSRFYVHEVSTNTWERKKDTLSPLSAARCAVVNHSGSGREMVVLYSDIDIYNFDADEWRNVRSINVNPSHGNILTYGQDGFLLVPPYNIDIYEWNWDNEILEKTALTLSPVRPGSAALTVTTDALLC